MPKPTPFVLPANFRSLCRTVKHDAVFRVQMGDDVLYVRYTHTDGKDRLLFKAPETVRIDRVDNAPAVPEDIDDGDGARPDRGGGRPVSPPPPRVAQGLGSRLAARRRPA